MTNDDETIGVHVGATLKPIPIASKILKTQKIKDLLIRLSP